jgi:hypothetical protein
MFAFSSSMWPVSMEACDVCFFLEFAHEPTSDAKRDGRQRCFFRSRSPNMS